MKNFKIQVEEKEAKFFKELIDKLGFVQYEEVESFTEPRIYPAADFEIRSLKDKMAKQSEGEPSLSGHKIVEDIDIKKRDSLSDIRDVISQIDKLRSRSK